MINYDAHLSKMFGNIGKVLNKLKVGVAITMLELIKKIIRALDTIC